MIPQRGSARVDRPTKDRANASCEIHDPGRVEPVGPPGGVDPSPVQGLVDVDVAKPRDQRLIQQGDLDRSSRASQTSLEFPGIDGGRLGPETTEKSILEIRTRAVEVDAAEPSGIDERQPSLGPMVRLQDPDRVAMWWRPTDPTAPQVDPPRHPESEHQTGSILESQDELLSAAIHPLEPESVAQVHRVETTAPATGAVAHHVPSLDSNPVDRRSDQLGSEGSTDGLDLGKFGHGSDSDARARPDASDRGRKGRDYTRFGAEFRSEIPTSTPVRRPLQ